MPYEFYKILHIVSLIMAVAGVGAVAQQVFITGTSNFPNKRLILIYHGVATFLVFVSGFGLMARIGLVGGSWPTWIMVKLAVWLLVLGVAPSLVMRLPKAKLWAWWFLPALLAIAVSAAVLKDKFI